MYPEDLRYTRDHEWVRNEGDTLRVGITDYAQDALGDIVFVTLPAVGDRVTAGEPCGEIESTKSVSDLNAPVSGTVVAANDSLDGSPELINSDPYGDGWIFDIRPDDAGDAGDLRAGDLGAGDLGAGDLLDAQAYQGTLDAS